MHGIEWLVDARGCSAASLRDLKQLQSLFASLIADLHLRPIGETLWHQFPGSGGITGLCLLAESHLACHTFPEHESMCVNLFCCVPREPWQFEKELKTRFRASEVSVRQLTRSYETVREKAASD
jgi:S-adenosylmethionine decarboxylase